MSDAHLEPVGREREASVLPFPKIARGVGEDRPDEGGPRLRSVIGDVLREERHAQERTLAEVADEAAVSLPYLSEVERGTKEVSSDLLAAICDALDLDLADVLERGARRLRITAPSTRTSITGSPTARAHLRAA